MIKLNSIYKSKIKYISGDDDYIMQYNKTVTTGTPNHTYKGWYLYILNKL